MTFCAARERSAVRVTSKLPANKAKSPLSRRSRRAAAPRGAQWVPSDANAPAGCAHEKGLQMQTFSKG